MLSLTRSAILLSVPGNQPDRLVGYSFAEDFYGPFHLCYALVNVLSTGL